MTPAEPISADFWEDEMCVRGAQMYRSALRFRRNVFHELNRIDNPGLEVSLSNAANFPSETWADEMLLRHLEITEDAAYFSHDIKHDLRWGIENNAPGQNGVVVITTFY